MKKNNAALIIQGGGVRGAFASGVLDVLLENNIEFPYVSGVSAGVLNAMNYISKDKGRSFIVVTKYMRDKRFYGRRQFIKNRSYFNFKFLFKDLADELPFNFDEYYNSKTELVAVATSLETGEAEYFYKSKMDPDIFMNKVCAATASIPLVSKKVEINGHYYLDGGVSMPVPAKQAQADGHKKMVIILSRPIGARKERYIQHVLMSRSPTFAGEKYKKFREMLSNQAYIYNDCLDYVENLDPSEAFIVAPYDIYDLKTTSTDTEKMTDLYNQGREIMENRLEELKKFIYE